MFVAAVFVCVAVINSIVEGVNVVVIPSHVSSHLIYMGQLGAAIKAEGHDVSILLPSNANTPELLQNTGVEVLTFPSPGKVSAMNSREFSKHLLSIAFSNSVFEAIPIFSEMNEMGLRQMEVDCEGRFQLLSEIKTRGFDFAIVDGADMFCTPLIPYALDIPFAFMSISMVPLEFRVPALPSFSPMQLTSYGDRMNFWQRTVNILGHLTMFLAANTSLHFVEKFVPERPPIEPFKFFQMASLWFLMDDPAFGYAQPLMPNVIPIADVMARPAKNLPEDIQLFLDEASEDAIFMSLGSLLNHVPQNIIDVFCDVFNKINQIVILRIPENKSCSETPSKKIMISSWFPQNDILGHPNVKLFITHAGLNSIVESIYHSVPMIAFPITLDQPGNAVRISHKQLGLQMNIADFTAEELITNIQRILNNESYQQSVHRASKMLKKRLHSPGQRASFWIEHVLELGDEHLRTGAYDLNIWQFMMLDVFVFMLSVVLLSACCAAKLLCCAFRCCSKTKNKSKME